LESLLKTLFPGFQKLRLLSGQELKELVSSDREVSGVAREQAVPMNSSGRGGTQAVQLLT
jgi:hypothetical protein